MTEKEQFLNLKNSISLAFHLSRSNSNNTLVFIHGFGSSKEHFRYAFTSPFLKDFTLIAIDLVGFGTSRGPTEFSYSMQDQATLVLKLLDTIEINSFHLCGHSMGGLIVLKMAELAPGRILSLIDLEGNLTPEDCFLSGKVADMSFTEFTEKGRRTLERGFRAAGLKDMAMREYADSFAAADAMALYKSALHTVQDSAVPMVDKLSQIKNACYIYGEKNRGIFPAEKLLHAAGIPVFYIPNAGHSMVVENPQHIYKIIHSFIDGIANKTVL